MKIFYICYSINPRTGIGRLVNDLIDSVKITIPGLSVSVATAEDLFFFNHKLKFFLNLKKILGEARQADFIHVFDAYPYGLLAVVIGMIVRRPVILTAVGTGSVKGLENFPKSLFMKLTYHSCYKLTAISHYVKKEILDVLPDLDIQVVCPGLSYHFLNQQNKEEINYFTKRKDYLLSVGSFKRRKGHDVSIRIFAFLAEKYPDLSFIIVGDPNKSNPYYREIDKEIEDLGLKNKVDILSNLSDNELLSLYRGAKLFVLLSRNDSEDIEGFGLVFLEAASAGAPVVGCLGTGAEDAIRDSVNGYLVDIRDEEDVAKKADRILNDKTLRERFSNGSVSFAKEMSLENSIKEYIKIYQQIKNKWEKVIKN